MIKVLHTGIYSSIQDLGRWEHTHYGVPRSGAMDLSSAKLANALLNNDPGCAVLEITMSGPRLEFERDTFMCISGADLSPEINGKALKLNTVTRVKPGDSLTFGPVRYGFRAYLAVSGGLKSPKVMNSRSMYLPVTGQSTIGKGDMLKVSPPSPDVDLPHASIRPNSDHFDAQVLEAYRGPEFEYLSASQQQSLMTREFTVAKENNRMAYQLEETFTNTLDPIITSSVLPGTVQLTPAGKLIILMRDGQTTGGYPRVLQLTEAAVDQLAQKFTGQTFSFKLRVSGT